MKKVYVQPFLRNAINEGRVKGITNFDRIKAMSVEELAEYLYNTDDLLCDEICKHSQVDYVCPYADEPTKEMCINCVKKWLESEVQGE